jgi:hypothetical protein
MVLFAYRGYNVGQTRFKILNALVYFRERPWLLGTEFLTHHVVKSSPYQFRNITETAGNGKAMETDIFFVCKTKANHAASGFANHRN